MCKRSISWNGASHHEVGKSNWLVGVLGGLSVDQSCWDRAIRVGTDYGSDFVASFNFFVHNKVDVESHKDVLANERGMLGRQGLIALG